MTWRIHGPVSMKGIVYLSGSKNGALYALSGALLANEVVRLRNVPNVEDVRNLLRLLTCTGTHIEREQNQVSITPPARTLDRCVLPDTARLLRGSVCLLAPCLVKFHEVEMPLPGGCSIGYRSIDRHLNVFHRMGASILWESNRVVLTAKKLTGCRVDVGRSVTTTVNAISAAIGAHGTTEICSAAREPEVMAYCRFMKECGAEIDDNEDRLIVKGGTDLHGALFEIEPDRIEAATWMAAAAITKSELSIKNYPHGQLNSIEKVLACQDYCCSPCLQTVVLKAEPYPGLPTDVLPLLAPLNTDAEFLLTDTVFSDRWQYLSCLEQMGGQFKRKKEGWWACPSAYFGAKVYPQDLRGTASVVLAALGATGTSEIVQAEKYMNRGYENFCEKLSNLGVEIDKIE